MKPLFTLIFLCCCLYVSGQSKIKGIVTDSSEMPVKYASVVLLKAKDSIMVDFILTNENGRFEFDNVKKETYLIQVSYLGYEHHWQTILIEHPAEEKNIMITLQPSINQLELVEIKANRNPMSMHKDTVEYHAAAFKTRPGDVVEDLLKKLPGVEVERDGSIKAYGESVQNVLVDGKEFFGKDTRIATKNLEADAIDKVQVFDKKSEMAEITGIEDGRDEKTINLKLKADKKNGYFGNIGIAGGTDDRFKSKMLLNRFNPTTKISLIGNGNNINEQSFSIQDYIEFMGGIGAFMSGSGGRGRIEINSDEGLPFLNNEGLDGIQKSFASGINLNHDFSSKTELNVSYFYNNLKNTLRKNAFIQNLLTEDNIDTYEDEENISQNVGHSINAMFKHKLDSFQTLILRLGSGLGNNNFFSDRSLQTRQANRESLSNNRTIDFMGNNNRYNASLTWQKKFRKKGRSFMLSGISTYNERYNEGILYSINKLFDASSDTLNQLQYNNDDNLNYTFRSNYSEPLGKGSYLQWNIMTSNNRNKIYSDFYDWLNESESVKNEILSNRYNNGYQTINGGMSFSTNQKKFNLTSGINYQNSSLSGNDENTRYQTRHFQALLPSVFASYEFKTANHLNVEYTTRMQEPSLQQLQPIVNNSDPLNLINGNPNLIPEYLHEFRTSYMLYDQFSFTSFFARLNGTLTRNKISDNIVVDSLARRTITPLNISSEKNINASVEFGTPIKPLHITGKIRYRTQLTKSKLFVNQIEDNTTRINHSLNLTFENRNKNTVDALVGYKWSINNNLHTYDERWSQKFTEHNIFGELNLSISDKLDFNTELDYRSFDQNNFGDKLPNIALWQAGITTYFMENKKLKVTLSVFDILNNNSGFRRSSNINYYRQDISNVLGRYFMLNFNYSIRGFAQKNGGLEIKFEN